VVCYRRPSQAADESQNLLSGVGRRYSMGEGKKGLRVLERDHGPPRCKLWVRTGKGEVRF